MNTWPQENGSAYGLPYAKTGYSDRWRQMSVVNEYMGRVVDNLMRRCGSLNEGERLSELPLFSYHHGLQAPCTFGSGEGEVRLVPVGHNTVSCTSCISCISHISYIS